jgi:hypothetical protein
MSDALDQEDESSEDIGMVRTSVFFFFYLGLVDVHSSTLAILKDPKIKTR